MVVPSASRSISIIWPVIVPIVVISSVITLIPSSTKGSSSRCKILSTHVLVLGPILVYL